MILNLQTMRNPDSQILALVAAIRSHDENALLGAAQGIDTNTYDLDGKTPLIHAAACGNAVAVEFLLSHDADPLRANLAGTESPFVIGILRRDTVITHLLLDAGRLAAQSRPREHRYDDDALFLDADAVFLIHADQHLCIDAPISSEIVCLPYRARRRRK